VTPNPVPFGPEAGITKITWNTGDDTLGEVFLSVNGQPETRIAGGTAQSSEVQAGFLLIKRMNSDSTRQVCSHGVA
jgi:hypothetical protein